MGKYFIITVIVTIFATFQFEVAAKPSPLGIFNGTDAEITEFPYVVQIIDFAGGFRCGGAILAPEWILTAAHCNNDQLTGSIIYGITKLHQYDSINQSTILVKEWFQHPLFQQGYFGGAIYDVGIFKLAEPIPFSKVAQPIKLAEANQDIPFHELGVLAGWGSNGINIKIPMETLQKANLEILTDEECTKRIDDQDGKATFLSEHSICTTNDYSGQCSGDSGSPFVVNGTQFGIVSWSLKPCGIAPGAYSRITNPEYRDWIRSITNL